MKKGVEQWKELTSQATEKEKTSMASGKEWKPKTAEGFFQEEDLKEEKSYQ